jgi:hypothetical protein
MLPQKLSEMSFTNPATTVDYVAIAGHKLLLYKVILKPIWTYGFQLWGSASASNIEILERFQSKAQRMIADAPWRVPNVILRQDLQIH